jgi:dephospho-CoA kinase
MMLPNIALWGKSGSGKSVVARHLADNYGFIHCSPGKICRRMCLELFDSEDRGILNAFNDAVRSIDPMVWLRTATKGVPPQKQIVFDSIRFNPDWLYFKQRGFQLWKIDCNGERRGSQLVQRGQTFKAADDIHPGEVELEGMQFDCILKNDSDIQDLLKQVDLALAK